MDETRPQEVLLFSEGSRWSVDIEYAGIVSGKSAMQMRNMRLASMSKTDFAATEIEGEELLYPLIDNRAINGSGNPFVYGSGPLVGQPATTYKCICAFFAGDYLFELWVDKIKVERPFFRLNGKVVAYSTDIPFSVEFPPQFDVDIGATGTEICITDFNVVPHIYNIQDLLENSGINFLTGEEDDTLTPTEKYFNDYDDLLYQLQLDVSGDRPEFIQISSVPPAGVYGGTVPVLGAGGQAAGSYLYCMRLKTGTGDAQLWSEPSVVINVPDGIGAGDGRYPFEKTYGAAPGDSTINGTHFRFRVTNTGNYSFCEIRRLKFTGGLPLGSLATDEVIHVFNIDPGEISVREFWDVGATGTPVTDGDDVQSMGKIKAAKGVRYFNDRLYLMNIRFAEDDASDIVFLDEPNVMYPTMVNIGRGGHKHPYHSAYHRTHLHGEKYGYAVVFRNDLNSRLFGVKVTGSYDDEPWGGNFTNFQMPNRRDVNSIDDLVEQNATTQMTVDKTFEAFDLALANQKTDSSSFKNIAKDIDDADDIGWKPYHPTSSQDSDVTGNNYRVNPTVLTISVHDPDNTVDYQPTGFRPTYFSLAMALAGVTGIPAGMKSFSIVRTPPAGRIFCQGLGMYSMIEGENVDDSDTNVKHATKDLNALWFYAPDVEAGLYDIQEVIDHPANYQVQLISPVGFFSELFSARHEALATESHCYEDIISYARILLEDGSINNGDDATTVGDLGHVQFGRWRNDDAVDFDALGDKGNHLFNITSVSRVFTKSGRQAYYKINFDENIYNNASVPDGDTAYFLNDDMRNWHEPFYVLNIVRKNANVDESANQTTYLNTGTYQKLDSIIGRSDGNNNNGNGYILVDERKEDCRASLSADNRFIWIEKPDGSVFKWIDISFKSGGQIADILNDIDTGGDGSGANADALLKGVYTVANVVLDSDINQYTFNKIVFDTAGDPIEWYVPEEGDLIHVRYDTTEPLMIFGDCVHGESTFAPIDSEGTDGGDGFQSSYPEQFALQTGWPYHIWDINVNLRQIYNTTTGDFFESSSGTSFKLNFIRQMVIMFCCTSRMHVPYAFNSDENKFFPNISYVMRPFGWDPALKPSAQHIDEEYETTYPQELDSELLPVGWRFGGLNWMQTLANMNIDYSEQATNFKSFSKPSAEFTLVTAFADMVIWSAKRNPGTQNDPGTRTFPPKNFRNLTAKYGALKKAWSAQSGSGDNLYAFAEQNICLILVDKFIARQETGGSLGILQGAGGDQVILVENWFSQGIGMPDELWRSAAEMGNKIWWVNKNSVYTLENEKVRDILRDGFYHGRIYPDMIKKLLKAYGDDLTGFYDVYHDEYWINYRKKAVAMGLQGVDLKTYGIPTDFCVDAAFFLLFPPVEGGVFSGPGVTLFGDDYYFIPSDADVGVWTIIFEYGYYISTLTITVHDLPTVTLDPIPDMAVTDSPVDLSSYGHPSGGSFYVDSDPDPLPGNVFDPGAAGVGDHTITYVYADVNTCESFATDTITVTS